MGYQEMIPPQKIVGIDKDLQSSGHSHRLLQFKEHKDNPLRHRVCILDGPVWNEG